MSTSCNLDETRNPEAFAWTGFRATNAGHPSVHSAEPILPAGAIRADLRWTASETSGSSDFLWENPRVLRFGGGSIFILDAMASRVYRIEMRTGAWTHTIARQGSGPGEIERAEGLVVDDEHLVILDGGNASLNFFRHDGEYVTRKALGALAFGIVGLSNGGVLVHSLQGATQTWRVLTYNGEVRPWKFPPWVEAVDSEPCWTVFEVGDGLGRASCFTPRLEALNSRGERKEEFVVERAPEEASTAELDDLRNRIRGEVTKMGYPSVQATAIVDRQVERFRVKRVVRAARYDSDRGLYAVWVQGPDEFGGGSAELLLLSRSGLYMGAVQFQGSWVDFDLHDFRVYALVQDSATGLVEVHGYQLMFPKGFLAWIEEQRE